MTVKIRIDTKEWRNVTEMTIARGAPCVSLHAQDMLAILDDLDAAHANAAHWKANHDNQVQRAMILTQRPDMPIERVSAYNRMLILEARIAQMECEK